MVHESCETVRSSRIEGNGSALKVLLFKFSLSDHLRSVAESIAFAKPAPSRSIERCWRLCVSGDKLTNALIVDSHPLDLPQLLL